MLYSQVTLAILVFVIAYALIISEKLHRAIISLAGAAVVIILGIITQEQAIDSVDFNTIGLLIGMMIIVGITRRSGAFEYLAIKASKTAKGDPILIMALLTLITGVLSAFLDNVTTVLLIVPVTFSITDKLDINPMPFLIAEIIGSNIGGTATLIGDPPNILIGSATHLGFLDFIINLSPIVILILPVSILCLILFFRKDLTVADEKREKIMELNEKTAIKDHTILNKSLFALMVTMIGFCLHEYLHLDSATIAIAGAVLLMIITKEEPEEILLTVEWPTLFFFIGLFVMVEGLIEVGVISYIANESLNLTQGNLALTSLLVLWLSGIASAIVDNIPFVTAMIPLLHSIGGLTDMPMDPVWWSLALGACLGGNGTIIGASANVVVAGISEKHGYPIQFVEFMKYGLPITFISLLMASAYVYLRYLL